MMLDAARLERLLAMTAARHAPMLSVPRAGGALAPGDLTALAAKLADEGALVIGAQADPPDPAAFKAWADAYTGLVTRLCQTLFPSYTMVNADWIDPNPPVIALFSAACPPVLAAIGAVAAPYALARAGLQTSDLEVRGVAELLLELLEAGDLAHDEYTALRDDVAAWIRYIAALPARTLAVTPPTRALVGAIGPVSSAVMVMPPSVPEPPQPEPPQPEPPPRAAQSVPAQAAPPPPPATVPEPPQPGPPQSGPPPSDIPPFRPDAVPIFFDPARRTDDAPPPPPIPQLPR